MVFITHFRIALITSNWVVHMFRIGKKLLDGRQDSLVVIDEEAYVCPCACVRMSISICFVFECGFICLFVHM